MNKAKLYWALQVGGWLMFAVIQIAGFIVFGEYKISMNQIWFWIAEAGLFLLITHAYRFFIQYRKWVEFRLSKLIPLVLLSVIILAFVVYCLRTLISIPLGMYNPDVVWSAPNIIGLTLVFALILFIWSTSYFIYQYFDRYNKALKHEAAMNEIELNNLKSQLNPHFIFNSLNGIRALVDEDPQKSKNSITRLSNILRNSLVSDKKKLTSFKEELRIVKDYLSLESIRFEERLKIKYDIHPDSSSYMVPPLMLQTLVENGVKHGISKLKEGGELILKTSFTDETFVIQIRNSGKYRNLNGSRKSGLGLKNSRQRLDILFADAASLTIQNEMENVVLTELILPQRTHESINNR